MDKFEKTAKEEIENEEKKKLEEEKEKRIKERAKKLREKQEKENKKIAEEEIELSELKTKRMNLLDKEKFIPNFLCLKCGKELKTYFSQNNKSLVIWCLCKNCKVLESVKSEDANKINSFLYYTEISVREFFKSRSANTISATEIEIYERKQKV